ncbi:MAG: hypothetical protein HY553_05685 [Elusimicrobia bacterium]|nr:hypothetical protein [Elusimicrobiota bacterium]
MATIGGSNATLTTGSGAANLRAPGGDGGGAAQAAGAAAGGGAAPPAPPPARTPAPADSGTRDTQGVAQPTAAPEPAPETGSATCAGACAAQRQRMLQIARDYVGAFGSWIDQDRQLVLAMATNYRNNAILASEKVEALFNELDAPGYLDAAAKSDRLFGTTVRRNLDDLLAALGSPDTPDVAAPRYLLHLVRTQLDPSRDINSAGYIRDVKDRLDGRFIIHEGLGTIADLLKDPGDGRGMTWNTSLLQDKRRRWNEWRAAVTAAASAEPPQAAPPRPADLPEDPTPYANYIETADWVTLLLAAQDAVKLSGWETLTTAQQNQMVQLARDHLRNTPSEPDPDSGFATWLHRYRCGATEAGQCVASGDTGATPWDAARNPESPAWIALRASCYDRFFDAACAEHLLQLRSADSAYRRALDPAAQGAGGQPLSADARTGLFIEAFLDHDTPAYNVIVEAECFMQYLGEPGACPSSRARYEPGTITLSPGQCPGSKK